MIAMRSKSSSRCLNRNCRRLVSWRTLRNRIAGNSTIRGLRRMIKCNTTGNATSAVPAKSIGFTNVRKVMLYSRARLPAK